MVSKTTPPFLIPGSSTQSLGWRAWDLFWLPFWDQIVPEAWPCGFSGGGAAGQKGKLQSRTAGEETHCGLFHSGIWLLSSTGAGLAPSVAAAFAGLFTHSRGPNSIHGAEKHTSKGTFWAVRMLFFIWPVGSWVIPVLSASEGWPWYFLSAASFSRNRHGAPRRVSVERGDLCGPLSLSAVG